MHQYSGSKLKLLKMRVKINEESYIKYAIWRKQVSNLCIDVFEVIVFHGELVKVG